MTNRNSSGLPSLARIGFGTGTPLSVVHGNRNKELNNDSIQSVIIVVFDMYFVLDSYDSYLIQVNPKKECLVCSDMNVSIHIGYMF